MYWVQRIAIAPWREGVLLNFTLWDIGSTAISIQKTIAPRNICINLNT